MKKTDRIKITARAFSDYNEIENDQDLKKNRLTLAEYHALKEVLSAFSSCEADAKTGTFIKGVAEWMKRHGYNVTEKSVNFVISF